MTQNRKMSAREAMESRDRRMTALKRVGAVLLTAATVGVAALTLGTRLGCGRNNEFHDMPRLREGPRGKVSGEKRPLVDVDSGHDASDGSAEVTEEVIYLKGSVLNVSPDSGTAHVTDQRDETELDETVIEAQPDGGFSVMTKLPAIGVFARPPSETEESD
ncbi:TPA: hypothetical protein EYP38_02885 [Candidatus Micrarchaeota archaeon]|nr:hypothetical protein [Candidatus Micrarchaeota archaeon]